MYGVGTGERAVCGEFESWRKWLCVCAARPAQRIFPGRWLAACTLVVRTCTRHPEKPRGKKYE